MIDAIRKFFDDHFDRKSEERGSERSLRLATAALLFEVASADYALDPAEQGLIKRLVEQRFALGEEETSELLSLAEEASREAPGLHGFTVLINEHTDHNVKKTINQKGRTPL